MQTLTHKGRAERYGGKLCLEVTNEEETYYVVN